MAENTLIEWADHTFNPWTGCTKVSPGCDHCYAEGWAKRSGTVTWGVGEPRRRTTPANWRKPVQWNAAHDAFFAEHGRRQRVFCASLADVFDNAVDPAWRADLFSLVMSTPNLDWLLLTKRIGNALPMMRELAHGADPDLPLSDMEPLPNLWVGATIVNQEEADRDIPKLLAVPARVRFLSMEPLLGPVDLVTAGALFTETGNSDPIGRIINQAEAGAIYEDEPLLHWVIVGGESGPGARPMHPDWARSLRDQCAAAGVPFLFKQWGEWKPLGQMPYSEKVATDERHLRDDEYLRMDGTMHTTLKDDHEPFDAGDILIRRVGKKAAGRLLDGVQHDGFPEVQR
jgi:protein gp37